MRPDDRLEWSVVPLGPNWLRKWLPADYIATRLLVVEKVYLDNGAGMKPTSNLSGKGRDDGHGQIDPKDEDLANVAKFPHLQKLYLRYTSISDDGVRRLQNLRKLRALAISFTGVTDESMSVVAGFENLTELRLVRTRITDAGLAKIAQLKHLEYLEVQGTHVTEDGLKPFRAKPGLRLFTNDANGHWYSF